MRMTIIFPRNVQVIERPAAAPIIPCVYRRRRKLFALPFGRWFSSHPLCLGVRELTHALLAPVP